MSNAKVLIMNGNVYNVLDRCSICKFRETKGNNASFKNSFLSMKTVLIIKERLQID